MSGRAVCLISGGLDSCVTLFIAKEEGYEIHGLSFNYDQVHKKEIRHARMIGKAAGVKNHVVYHLDKALFHGSSLVDKEISIPLNRDLKTIGGGSVPSTYVPARNLVFLSLSTAYAEMINADAVFIGVHATDYSGYPDCRPEFIESIQQTINKGTRRGVEGKPVMIKAPLLYLSKTEIIKKGLKMRVPFDLTWSCYKGEKKACGVCDSCLLRLKGFQEAGYPDPVPYQSYPSWYILK